MPGIIVFRRRWGVGSDDLVVPGLCLSLLHIIWLAVTVTTLVVRAPGETQNGTEAAPAEDARMTATNTSKPITWQQDESCHQTLHLLLQLHIVVLALCLVLEVAMVRIALKGTMWNFAPRHSMEYVLYARLLVLITHVIWSSLSIFWLHGHYVTCPVAGTAKQVLLGAVICNACVALSVIVTVWCTFDRAGRSWVKMKRFQRSMRDGETKFHYRRSGNHRPNWRQRKVMRTYQDTWNHRCKFLFCCMSRSDQYQDSFSEIARLLTDFFRDLDLVPTDIVAGLVLLRKQQKELQETKVNQVDGIYEFLSGVPVTPKTRFVSLSDPDQLEAFRLIAHYMKFALAAYGWPMYLLGHSTTGLCLLCSQTRCCCTRVSAEEAEFPFVVGDTCSGCHSAALRQACGTGDFEVLYATFHVDVAETPFFVALDYDHQSVIVSIRGTISMKDVITDLHAEAEPIPFQVPIDDWIGHKGMVQCATYIRNKLRSENLLERAFAHRPEKGTSDFQLVLVGHSLGAGTAAILALLLRSEYPDVHCYAYSPPGGLLSLPAAESTKEFVTSVVVGKDVVPRLGLHQLETLRSSLITAIKKSTEPKWQILASSMLCCGHSKPRASELESTSDDGPKTEMPSTSFATHPSDPNITLSMHQPLYPPGRIIHIVRQHLKTDRRESRGESSGERCSSTRSDVDPIYQAVWADTCDFKEVLISPVMVQDHMPDNVLRALNKVLSAYGPAKPERASPGALPDPIYDKSSEQYHRLGFADDGAGLRRTLLETSFTSIDKSPMLGWRQFDERSSGDGAASSQVSSVGRPSVVQPPWTQYAVASSQQAACDTLADRWDVIEGLSALPDEALQTYTNSLVAPMAASETLSEESSASSRGSIVRRVRVWRRARPEPTTTSVGTFLVPLDPTEGSSVYCLSPLSSVRAVGGGSPATRSQLKKEIMRLYQRAAADIDDGQETSSPERNESSSSQVSQPNSPPNSYSSPVFRHCASFDESSPGRTAFAVGRPATTEELVNTSLQQSPPSRYTSF